MYMFFDTETTGKWNFKKDFQDAEQPHLVQLGIRLDDADRNILAEVNLLIALPEEVEVEAGALAVHGISKEKSKNYGVKLTGALYIFDTLARSAEVVIAHNSDFDTRVMKRAYALAGKVMPAFPTYCTMKSSTGVCKVPSPRGSGYKWPTLQEAFRILVDVEGFEGAHDAMVDVRACRDVYYALLDGGHIV